ncbi:hypothetical protein ACSBR1_002468 [Camellia fascicularis]
MSSSTTTTTTTKRHKWQPTPPSPPSHRHFPPSWVRWLSLSTSSTASLRSGALNRSQFRFSILNLPKLRRRLIGGNRHSSRCSGHKRARNAKKR